MDDFIRSGADDFGPRLSRLGQNWRRQVDAEIRTFGLTDATWRPLFYLGRYGDGMRQNDLASALDIEGPSLVRLLDALEKQSLVERCIDAEDRRVKTLRMTPKGEAAYSRIVAVYRRVSEQALRNVSDADIAVCNRVFDRIEAALNGYIRGNGRQEP
jgi:MarR family transcriptional regulator for hemolysin